MSKERLSLVLNAFSARIGYSFANPDLLSQALTHCSAGQPNNERLEFLGDSVLSCALSTLLYARFPDRLEGELSRTRSNLVNQQSLYQLAVSLQLAEALKLGEGERKSGGRSRPSILADALEAVLGAVCLDGGFSAALALVERLYTPLLTQLAAETLKKDPKTRLQECLQQQRLSLPLYRLVSQSGRGHAQQFEIECVVEAFSVFGRGSGTSRRLAEQAAAKQAFDRLTDDLSCRPKPHWPRYR